MKQFLIVFHSQSSRSETLALALYQSARQAAEVCTDVLVTLKRCVDCDADDFIQANLVILLTPENFAAISGGMKDLLDRVYYPLERAEVAALPYMLLVSAGNDGSGCVRQMERILSGIKAKAIQAPQIFYGDVTAESLAQVKELGESLTVGVDMGVF